MGCFSKYSVAVVLIALVLPWAGSARADTIVLKNGQRIVAVNITRENGKVSGETQAGVVTLPESMVERIEKDDHTRLQSNQDAAGLDIAPPVALPADSNESASAIVHGGTIDRDALARLDAKASSGATQAVANAIAGEVAAGRFAIDHGDLDDALSHAKSALSFAPGQIELLLNVAYVHLRRGDYTAALDDLDGARRIEPDSPEVAKLTGWADYGLSRLPQAVEQWKRSQALKPDAEVARALEKAERDLDVEGNFREGESAHFVLKYSGAAEPDLARAVLHVLEDDFDDVSYRLNETPAEPIAVVLYTDQVFADITRAPGWVGALNDGRIRIPVQGLVTVTPELARVLKHELAHSFVTAKTHGRAPVWLQEGIAQWIEGKSSQNVAGKLLALYDSHADPSLAALEQSWLGLQPDFVGIAYNWSLAVVEGIEARGSGDLVRLLDRIAAEPTAEAALRSALRLTYTELNDQTAEYLRHAY